MPIEEITSIILVYVAFCAFSTKRMMTYMHVLQQEDYLNQRLRKWIFKNAAFDKRLSFGILVLGCLTFVEAFPSFILHFLIFISFAIVTYLEKDPRKNAKKKLVLTTRAKRIFLPAVALSLISGIWYFMGLHPWLWIASIQAIPFLLILINSLLQPFEDSLQQNYWNEAKAKINALNPTIIGITGSFGKTSVKHILGHVLKSHAPTLITPGSVNTPMGITRIIREQLDESHQYLVVEMGAYGKGSIERLCRLTPPDFGVITAIGHAHYERFKSLDTVSRTKFELAEAVIAKEGTNIIHERTLRFPYPRDMKNDTPNAFVVCGDPAKFIEKDGRDVSYINDGDLQIIKTQQLDTGLMVTIKWKKDTHIFEIPLFGLHHAHNAALAFATAITIGLKPDEITRTFKSLPQIDHRLEVRKQPDNTTIIDDAYNSNPQGFRGALDVLEILKKDKRGILITPGMVEMGSAHNDAHSTLGEYAAATCDVAVVVVPERIPTFIKGYKRGHGKQLVEVKTFEEASQWLAKNKQDGDVILIENDLPDMYERVPKM